MKNLIKRLFGKRYCGDCVYLRVFSQDKDQTAYGCAHKRNMRRTWMGEAETIRGPHEINKNMNCAWFKAKTIPPVSLAKGPGVTT